MNADIMYLSLLEEILVTGKQYPNRTGTDTLSVFGRQMRFDLRESFPALTTKRLAWKSVVSELLWFLEGSDDERRLAEIHYGRPREELVGKSTIWTANADAQGRELGYYNGPDAKRLGPIYGVQWRSWRADRIGVDRRGIGHGRFLYDQIDELIRKLRDNPDDRRLILTAWNVAEIANMALPPCHCFAQFRVYDGELNCMLTQRSADMFLGVPFNFASYALLTHILARETGLRVGDLIHSLGDAHIYVNHIDQVMEQLQRTPLRAPMLKIDDSFCLRDTLEAETPSDAVAKFTLEGYESHGSIRGEMAV